MTHGKEIPGWPDEDAGKWPPELSDQDLLFCEPLEEQERAREAREERGPYGGDGVGVNAMTALEIMFPLRRD